jgi:hypothetical protein
MEVTSGLTDWHGSQDEKGKGRQDADSSNGSGAKLDAAWLSFWRKRSVNNACMLQERYL